MTFSSILRAASKLAAGAIVTLSLSVGAWAGSFSDEQQGEIGEIVKKYLLTNPEILRDAFRELERRENEAKEKLAQKGITDNAEILYKSKLSYVAGNAEGDISMVEFFDYNCGFCKRSVADVLRFTEEDKNLRIVMKEFPILSEGSIIASRAAIASKKQGKYWELHLALMAASGSIDNEAKVMSIAAEAGLDVEKLKADMTADSESIEKSINDNRALAQSLGINGTPAFVIDDNLVPGAMPYEQLATSVKIVRDKGGCQFC